MLTREQTKKISPHNCIWHHRFNVVLFFKWIFLFFQLMRPLYDHRKTIFSILNRVFNYESIQLRLKGNGNEKTAFNESIGHTSVAVLQKKKISLLSHEFRFYFSHSYFRALLTSLQQQLKAEWIKTGKCNLWSKNQINFYAMLSSAKLQKRQKPSVYTSTICGMCSSVGRMPVALKVRGFYCVV